MDKRVCPICGLSFAVTHTNRLYCSPACRRHAQYKRIYPSTVKHTPQQLQWLESRSFENIVNFYRDGLLELHRTGKMPGYWTTADRKNMSRHGVVTQRNKSRYSPWSLTPRAQEILNGDSG